MTTALTPPEARATSEQVARAATRRVYRYRIAVFLGDVAMVALASWLAVLAASNHDVLRRSDVDLVRFTSLQTVSVWVAAAWVVVLFLTNSYSRRRLSHGTDEYKAVVVASLVSTAGLSFLAYLTRTDLSRTYYVLMALLCPVLLVLWRLTARLSLRQLRSRGRYVVLTAVLGKAPEVEHVIRVLRREPWAGYVPHAVILTDRDDLTEVGGVPVAGTTRGLGSRLGEVVEAMEAQALIVTASAGASNENSDRSLQRLLWQLEDADVSVIVVPNFDDIAGPRIRVRPVAGLPLLHLQLPEFTGPQRLVKRVMGLVVAGVLLVLLAPVFAVVALLVRASSPGPVLFRQTRVGQHGREFTCLKFRTMYVDAEERLVELRTRNDGNGLLFKLREDPRTTRVGRMLRRYSLDELPQLINVLRGDMALVGPRPPVPEEVARYQGDLHRRLLVRPGMTGLWQVSGRSDLSLEESTRLDLYYIDNWSLMHDIEIIGRTLSAVITGRGAY